MINVSSTILQSHHQLYFNHLYNIIESNKITFIANVIITQKQIPTIASGSINDLPFFCALECKVRKRTNIWIKLRAGDDASYMKMISPSK